MVDVYIIAYAQTRHLYFVPRDAWVFWQGFCAGLRADLGADLGGLYKTIELFVVSLHSLKNKYKRNHSYFFLYF
jgi:hypothetical protein